MSGEFTAWINELKKGGRPKVYSGENLRCVAMPMGGIGAGQIALCGDGSLRQWQIVNIASHLGYIPDSFFAIWTKTADGKIVAKLLQSDVLYDKDFEPAKLVNDHVIPDELKRLARDLPGVKETEFVGEYPIAEINFKDDELPVDVSLQSFSPFAPLESKDSGLPAIIFEFTVRNNSVSTVHIALAGTLQNAVGWDGESEIIGVQSECYGGNVNDVIRSKNMTAINMSNVILPKKAASNGTMTLATMDGSADARSAWTDRKDFRRDFWNDGRLENAVQEPSPAGKTVNGALAVPFTLQPGEEKKAVFAITWHFPNHYVDWDQKGFGVEDDKSRFYLGNMYNNWFADSLEVAEYVRENYNRLAEMTRLFKQTFYDSDLPYWFLDAVSSQISTIRTPTCLWNEDGNFHGFEGCCGASAWCANVGCCPMDCTHVWNYEQTLSKLFPDLERTMRYSDLKVQMREDGQIPYRMVLPLYLKRWQDAPCADGQCGTILKTYREFLQTGDKAFLDDYWPEIKKAMQYIYDKWDQDGDGVMDGPQWNTYDCNVYGHNSFIGTYYLAALRACEEMAKIQGELDLANSYRERYEKGCQVIEDELWNGEYYIQIYDEEKYKDHQYGIGCHSDQVVGQWWAHILGLGYILDPERIKSALKSIYKYNFRENFIGFEQKPRIYACDTDKGLLCCSWPKGGRPEGKVIIYADEVWTGIEYQVASHMIFEGLVDEGLQIAKAARDRYNGSKRNPWNEIECGDHYVRPMSSWRMLETAAGFHYDGLDKSLSFDPRLGDGEFRSFFIANAGWGTYSQSKSNHSLSVAYGKVELKTISLQNNNSKVSVKLNGKKIGVSSKISDGKVEIVFADNVTLTAGDNLDIASNE